MRLSVNSKRIVIVVCAKRYAHRAIWVLFVFASFVGRRADRF